MRITGIIEKGSDGMYSIRSEQHFGDSYFGGFGNTVAEAKQDFKDSIQEAMEEALLSGKSAEPIEVSFQYDLPSFFNDFDFINASREQNAAVQEWRGISRRKDSQENS